MKAGAKRLPLFLDKIRQSVYYKKKNKQYSGCFAGEDGTPWN